MKLKIENPKRAMAADAGRASWYPYYAGFSTPFAEELISSSGLGAGSCVVDPWNGSGTTTAAALRCGYPSCGFDLNPAMVVVSKARLLSAREKPSLAPLARDIIVKARTGPFEVSGDDPLLAWFAPRSVAALRALEAAVQKLLVDPEISRSLTEPKDVADLSDLAAFFYTALFRTLRRLGAAFASSNPAWVKLPDSYRNRSRPNSGMVWRLFEGQVARMVVSMGDERDSEEPDVRVSLSVASSEAMPLGRGAADFVLSSPPYCTRLDYAVAARLELALMGYSAEKFASLRRSLIGSTTVESATPVVSRDWGAACNGFLRRLRGHGSKASGTYYYKNHVQYFRSIWKSLWEISRVLRDRGTCVLVVQDSYYKDIHNDLPRIFVEMADANGLSLFRREDFPSSRSMAGINPRVRRYRTHFGATESVLCLSKS